MAFNPKAASFNPKEGLEAFDSSSQSSMMPSNVHTEVTGLRMSSGDIPPPRFDQNMYPAGASQYMASTASQYNTSLSDRMCTTMPHDPPQQFTPDARRDVTIDDLSKGLGLPGRQQPAVGDGPLGSTLQQSFGTFDNKLITMALDKALTPDGLAEYFRGQSNAAMATRAISSHQPQRDIAGPGTPDRALGETSKVVHPPPGFSDESSRKIFIDEPRSVESRILALGENPMGQTASRSTRTRTISQPLEYTQYQSYSSIGGQRMRSYTRTKRADQGPEPSAADVYPDDAYWAQSHIESHTGFTYNRPSHHRQSSVVRPSPGRQLKVNDTVSWPTPAEVYNPTPPVEACTYVPKLELIHETDDKEELGPVTREDLDSADDDVLATIDELPSLSVPTMLRLGVFDLTCDDRPLTPSQQDGSRYGIRFHGLAVGDSWLPPRPWEADSSNTFPVDDNSSTFQVAGDLWDGWRP
ncbi:hypothetical protein IQ07DRAFT_588290 [Pyrenochaeta sp. DS3sAY3a]|nr:hypothetical protein IQ07DRAFT_588290 [Pyrenochaeta sp. DS3sAY3a]